MNADERRLKKAQPRTNIRGFLGLAVLSMMGVAGCTVGPDYKRPATTMPSEWHATTTAPTTQESSVANLQPADLVTWWTGFKDPTLDSLIARSIESNLDLKQAEARIVQARASRGIATSGFWPSVDANGSYTHSDAGPGDSSNSVTGGGNSRGRARDSWIAGGSASWEPDLFGRVRRDVESATADLQASVEDRRDVLVIVASEVALDYIDLRGLQRQLFIAKENLEAQQRNLALTRRRAQGGLVRGLDVANAEAQVASTLSQIPLLESAAQQQIYNIALLLGLEPAALVKELVMEAPIPTTPPMIPIGLPSDLLRRRPDIRRAEEQLHSATARIGVATADLFPTFSLTGNIGVQGNSAKSLGNWDNRYWSVGPGVTWNIFDAGRIRSNIEVQKAVRTEFLAAYQKAVLTALHDVEVALVAYAKEQIHRTALASAVQANRRAVDISTQLYTEGQTDFLNVLTAQRSLYVSEDALVQSDRNVATNLVTLYRALGGGWEFPGDKAPTTAPTTN
jgi:multidrug efflux system outer membrane protein